MTMKMKNYTLEDELTLTCQYIVNNNSKYITSEQIKILLKYCGNKFTDETISELLHESERRADGLYEINDFVEFIMRECFAHGKKIKVKKLISMRSLSKIKL